GGALDSAAALEQRRVHHPHYLRAVAVHRDDIGLEGRACDGRDAYVVVSAWREFPGFRLELARGRFVFAIHPDGGEAFQVGVVGFAEAERDRGERANHVVLAARDRPSVAARDADRLAYDPILMEVAARNLDAFRDRIAMANHAHRKRESIGSHIARDGVVELLQLRTGLFVHGLILTPKRIECREVMGAHTRGFSSKSRSRARIQRYKRTTIATIPSKPEMRTLRPCVGSSTYVIMKI